MDTETYFQIIDKFIVARLKEYHFNLSGNKDAAGMAREQAESLAMAGEVRLWEYATGRKKPTVFFSTRFHDHAKIEGRFGPHSAEMPEPKTVFEAVSLLAKTHATYWTLQTRVQGLKKFIKDEWGDVAKHHAEFVDCQRKIDLENNTRNRLVEAGDRLLAEILSPKEAP